MNLFKNDTLSNVLLIATLFFVVYYLTKSKSDRECFANCSQRHDPVYCCDKNKKHYKKIYGNSCKANVAGCKTHKKYLSSCDK